MANAVRWAHPTEQVADLQIRQIANVAPLEQI